jgi:uncharacterized protein (DUF58 family)
MDATRPLSWKPTPHHRRLATVGLLAAFATMVTGRPQLLALAAPLLITAAVAPRHGLTQVTISTTTTPDRCIEEDDVEVSVTLDPGPFPVRVDLTLRPADTAVLDSPQQTVTEGRTAGLVEARWMVRTARWGRRSPGILVVRLQTIGGMTEAVTAVPLVELLVFPAPSLLRTLVVPPGLPDQIGAHASRAAGSGVEFAGIRAYVPGDPLREVNWPASLRRGSLHVTLRAAERAAPVVIGVDALSDVGSPGQSTLDRSVRGAVATAQAYLRTGDRVGFLVLGGGLGWLRPDTGGRQLYRIVERVLSVRRDISVVTPSLDRVPPVAMPPAALVVLFSPLLDDRTFATVTNLRQRGRTVVVVDVLTSEPPAERKDRSAAVALRLWRLDRSALRYQLAEMGVPVISWDGRTTLEQAVSPLARQPLPVDRPR